MTTSQRIAFLYGASLAGAAAVAWYRGKALPEVATDALVHGALVGTGLNVGYAMAQVSGMMPELGLWGENEGGDLEDDGSPARPNALTAKKKRIKYGMGSLGKGAVALLSTVNPDLLAPRRSGNWIIGPVPTNPYTVDLLP